MEAWRNAAKSMWEEIRGWPAWLLSIWLLAMLTMPISNWIWGEQILYLHISLTVLLQASLSVALLARDQDILRTALTVAIVFVLSWALEAVGAATGIPFGHYHYTEKLQPQVANVPLLIMAAWMMMLPPAWAVGWRLGKRRYGLTFIIVSGLAITAWDLFLDPQMVRWELWLWDQPGAYFGIPLVNFGGWFLGGALITAAARPRSLPDRPLLLIYGLTWILETIGLTMFWNLPGPAVLGYIGMGILVILAWQTEITTVTSSQRTKSSAV
jgi:putative membrane protein